VVDTFETQKNNGRGGEGGNISCVPDAKREAPFFHRKGSDQNKYGQAPKNFAAKIQYFRSSTSANFVKTFATNAKFC